MQNRRAILTIVIIVVVLAAIFGLADGMNRGRFDWSENFDDQKEQPYDLSITQRFLKSNFPENKYQNISSKLAQSLPNNGSYKNFVFVGEAINTDSADIEQLLNFVKTGGTAFISSKTIPIDLMHHLSVETCESENMLDYLTENVLEVRLKFTDNTLNINELAPFSFTYRNEPQSYNWTVMDPALFCEAATDHVILGKLNDTLINFARWTFGEGQFLFHSNPVVFSNYFLVAKNGQQYATGVFSHLQSGDIFWDQYSRIAEATGRSRNSRNGGPPHLGESPLSYILKQPPLAWAWYLLIGLVLVFVFFRGKRRQRVIPILPKLENTTLDFVKTIGNIAFKQQNHSQLCQRKMRLFFSFLRERYHLLNPPTDPDFGRQLSIVSRVPQAEIDQIFAHFHTVQSNLGDEKTMIALHQSIERFYQTCK